MSDTPPTGFAAASAVTRVEPGRYQVQVEPSWFQGPGAFGGLTAAWLLRAMTDLVDAPDRHPRELSGSFCARVREGPGEIEARIMRVGLNVSFVTAELRQRGKVAATGSAVFSASRPDGVAFADLPAPEVTPPEEAPLWTLPGGLPAYTDNFEIRHCLGTQPLEGLGTEAGVWVRSRTPGPVDPPLAAALLDSFAPAFFTRVRERRPAGTVAWSVHFLAELPRTETAGDAFHLLRVRSPVAAGGYSSEDDELWTTDGVLIARARQLVAAI
jgi:acyl-CoA thioesterase